MDFSRYNASDHPLPFHKAQDLGKAPKKLTGGPAPDLEEAFVCLYNELYDEISTNLQFQIDDIPDDEEEDVKPKESTDDISGDKLIQAPKKRKTAGTTKTKASKKS
jgi:replication factor C subunit 1